MNINVNTVTMFLKLKAGREINIFMTIFSCSKREGKEKG